MKDEFKINLYNLRETEKLAQKIAKRLEPKSFISFRTFQSKGLHAVHRANTAL